MSKKRLGFLTLLLAVLAIGSVLLAACARPGTTSGTAQNGGTPSGGGSTGNTVHMGNVQFMPTSVKIAKGSKLTLIDDVAVTHIIANGFYDPNGTPKPVKEPGAPTVSNLQFSSAGESKQIGPFSTAGTFHLYCTVHVNMNLTITVK